jgi:hypothetical protein
MIEVGQAAPGFSLTDQAGNTVTLEGCKGIPFILYQGGLRIPGRIRRISQAESSDSRCQPRRRRVSCPVRPEV